MPQIAPIRLDDGTIIYIEVAEDVNSLVIPIKPEGSGAAASEEPREGTRGEQGQSKGWGDPLRRLPTGGEGTELVINSFKSVETTIRAYTNYTLNAFKQVAIANVDKVTLEFGIELGGEAGVPYVTKGTVKSNLKITVQCSFPKPTPESGTQTEGQSGL